MSKISITYSNEGVLLKVRPKKFRKLEGKNIKEAISFVNDECDAKEREHFKEMANLFERNIKEIKESCLIYGIKLED